ncbi:hypothetical protein CLOP_g9252 [Closterium sp. NIES-67]|nr:hypothetical protein CLOP_g9252 [Closterium sp. NIES-67]
MEGSRLGELLKSPERAPAEGATVAVGTAAVAAAAVVAVCYTHRSPPLGHLKQSEDSAALPWWTARFSPRGTLTAPKSSPARQPQSSPKLAFPLRSLTISQRASSAASARLLSTAHSWPRNT